jgi:hypothetical protein
MTANIYDLHRKAFAILDASGTHVANVSIKYPKDGAGRLWAYCHYIGADMQRALAGGYGYDKRTPAVVDAFLKATFRPMDTSGWSAEAKARWNSKQANLDFLLAKFKASLRFSSGEYWDRQLENAGYRVIQVI